MATASGSQSSFGDFDPPRAPVRNRGVVEIIRRLVDMRRFAISEKDVGAGTGIQHEREILATHCQVGMAAIARHPFRGLDGVAGLDLAVRHRGVVPVVSDLRLGAEGCRSLQDGLANAPLRHVLDFWFQRPDRALERHTLGNDVVGR